MSGMVLVDVVKRHGGYGLGDRVWLHESMAAPLIRAGLVALVSQVPPQRQDVVEEMVAAPAPEMAVRRRGRRRG